MSTIAFFTAVFCSFVWLFCAFRFVAASLSGMSFFDAGILNVLLYTLFVCLPVLLLWMVFALVSQYLHNRSSERQMYKLFAQMKKNQEYSDLLARIMLETEQNIKNAAVFNHFELLIADINELLSEIMLRSRLASVEQVENMWNKARNGGKWSFGKALIENYNRQPALRRHMIDDAGRDNMLAGSILELCARYQTMLELLEKHDKEKIFLGIVETGVLGKVFAVLAPVADEIRRSRESFVSVPPNEFRQTEPSAPAPMAAPELKPVASSADKTESKKGLFGLSPFGQTKPAQEEPATAKDAFSLALERSFGNDADSVHSEPVHSEPVFDLPPSKETDRDMMHDVATQSAGETEYSFDSAQKTLDSLKKEWLETDNSADKTADEDLTYPFGGWTDAGNYQK